MKLVKSIGTIAVLGMLAAACAKTGAVTEMKQAPSGLSKYESISIQTTAAKADLKPFAQNLNPTVAARLKNSAVFSKVSTEGKGKLVLSLRLTERVAGNKAARMMNMGGETEYVVKAELKDTEAKKTIGECEIKGDSKHTSSWSVGGYNSKFGDTGDNLDARAATAVADALADYFEAKK